MATAQQPDIPWFDLEQAILGSTSSEQLIMALHLLDVTKEMATTESSAYLAKEFVAIARATAEVAPLHRLEDLRMA